ncbi:hypothetical protein JNB88_27885 [Rhizobium cauense]|uniref:hypothetical protein n=1 Tax=Rhizobium cauense TaxID=1166683 RepID=UPI001C6F2DB6|nr:hypothetical protein [Rhizobium cauense]MBW9117446.1 hypothetical protein [Rhizobium cauense]
MTNGTNTSSFWQGGVCGAAGSLLFNAWIVPFVTRAFDKIGAGPEEVADAVFRWIEQYIDLGISSAGNLWGAPDPNFLRLVYYSLQVVFPAVAILIGLELKRLFERFWPRH